MSTYSQFAAPTLVWSESTQDKRRFQRVLVVTAVLLLGFFIVLDNLSVPPKSRYELEKVPQRVALLIKKKKQQAPPPKPVEQPRVEKPKEKEVVTKEQGPVVKQERTAENIRQARQVAEKSGLMAMKSQLSAVRSLSMLNKISSRSLRSSAEGRNRVHRQDRVSSNAYSGSGGIDVSDARPAIGSQLAQRGTVVVDAPEQLASARAESKSKRRSSQSIQLVFDRHKSAFYQQYRRALRSQLGLEGRVVFKLKILPSGEVSKASIVSSELNSPDLEKRLLLRIKMINFGAKPVEAWEGTYPIDFTPLG